MCVYLLDFSHTLQLRSLTHYVGSILDGGEVISYTSVSTIGAANTPFHVLLGHFFLSAPTSVGVRLRQAFFCFFLDSYGFSHYQSGRYFPQKNRYKHEKENFPLHSLRC